MNSVKSKIAFLFLGALFTVLLISACNSNPPVVSPKTIAGTLPTFTPTPCNSTFGDSTVEGSSTTNSGSVQANMYYFSGGTIKGLSLYTSGIGQIRLGIYTDNGSYTAPANLLAQSAAVSTVAPAGWSVAPITPLVVASGYYWLAYQTTATVSNNYTYNATTALPYIT